MAGPNASGPSGALDGRGLGDALDGQAGQTGEGREVGLARQAGVDHRGDRGEGQRALGDVGREDDAGAFGRAYHPVLGVHAEAAVENGELDACRLALGPTGALGLMDLPSTGEEDQDVAIPALPNRSAHGSGHPALEVGLGVASVVLDGDRELATGHVEGGRVEVVGEGLGVEGGAHGHRVQIRSGAAAQPLNHREGQVGVEVALVDLVEDHRADAAELGVGDQPADEDALGDEDQPGLRGDLGVEADSVADLVADRAAALAGDAAGGQASGHAPRLEHQDLAGDHVEEQRRHPRRLAGAGLGDDDRGAAILESAPEGGEVLVDGQRFGGRHRSLDTLGRAHPRAEPGRQGRRSGSRSDPHACRASLSRARGNRHHARCQAAPMGSASPLLLFRLTRARSPSCPTRPSPAALAAPAAPATESSTSAARREGWSVSSFVARAGRSSRRSWS